MRLWIGIATFVVGALIYYLSHQEPPPGAPWMPRLGLGVGALGLSTLALTQTGLPWLISSICFSLVAIALIGLVIVEILRRR